MRESDLKKADGETAFVNDSATRSTLRNTIERHALWILAGAVVVALAIRLAVVAMVYPLFLDPVNNFNPFGYEMGHVAYAIMTGHGFANPYWGPIGLSAKVPPIYVYFMVGVFKIFGIYTKKSAIFILSVGSLFSALTIIPVFFIGKQIAGVRTALWASWFWVFFPPSFYFASDRMWYFSMATFLVPLLIWAGFGLAKTPNLWAWIGFGVLGGFAALTNPVIITILPILGLFACYRLWKSGKPFLAQGSLCTLVFFVALAPWLIRNYEVFHKFVFIRDDFWLEFNVGNVGDWYYRWNGAIHPGVNPAELQEYVQLGELPYMQVKKREVVAYVEAHPGQFMVRTIRRFIYVWTGFWNMRSEYGSAVVGRIIMLCYTCLTLLTIVGLVKVYQDQPDKAIVLGLILFLFPGVYYITHIELSYRHPIDPICGILACYALVARLEAATERKTARPRAHSAAIAHLDTGQAT